MGKTAKDYERDYTDPELRERLKEEIKASDRGGRAGTWSARKSQLLAQEYERQGGGYRHPGEKTEAQLQRARNLARATLRAMQLPREMVLERIRSTSDAATVEQAESELPEKVDTEGDRDLLERFGLDARSLEDAFEGQPPNVG